VQTFREQPIDPKAVEQRYPGINVRVQQLTEERLRYEELQRLRREGLLTSPDDFLADVQGETEENERREAETVTLGDPEPDDRVRRIASPTIDDGSAQSGIIAGHWLLGMGIVLEAIGAAVTWSDGGFSSSDAFLEGGPGQGMMLGGGVLITSALFSYLFSAIGNR
jgi:hypothetical protein